MTDEPKTTEDSTAPVEVTPTSPKPAEKTFTQSDLDDIITRRLAKERERANRQVAELESKLEDLKKGPPPKTTTTKSDKPKADDPRFDQLADQVSNLTQQLESERSERTFAERIVDLGLDDKKKQALRMVWDPNDPSKFDAMLDAFGVGQEVAPAADVEQAQEESGAEPTPSYKSPGAPAGEPEGEHLTDATKWTRDMIDRWTADGSFLRRVNEYRDRIPGGSGGLFRKGTPKMS